MNRRISTREEIEALGVKVPTHKALLRDLRAEVLRSLGVNSAAEESKILDHAVSNACMELDTIAVALESLRDVEANAAGLAVRAVAERLQLAQRLGCAMWHPDHPQETFLPNGGLEQ